MDKFGKLLRKSRKEKKKTIKDIAQITGFSITYISDVENGRRRPFAEYIIKQIEEYLDIKDKSLVVSANKERSKSSGIAIVGTVTKPVDITLNPEEDIHVLMTLKYITKHTENKELKQELKKWIDEIEYIFYSGK